MLKTARTLCLLLAAALSGGCSPHASVQNNHYLNAMQEGIQRQFHDADRYHGKVCRVTLKYAASQRYQVLRTEGDERLCLKTWSLVASATHLPAPPPELADGVAIDFRP